MQNYKEYLNGMCAGHFQKQKAEILTSQSTG